MKASIKQKCYIERKIEIQNFAVTFLCFSCFCMIYIRTKHILRTLSVIYTQPTKYVLTLGLGLHKH